MNKSKVLRWNPEKIFHEGGETHKICANISLDDDCHNMYSDFSITADVYIKRRNGRWVWYSGGCQHEIIARRFPELKRFIPLHLCSHDGSPMYPVENGFYHVGNSEKEVSMNYLRITESEYDMLFLAKDDIYYFKYLLFHLGIVARWQKEADEFIRFLEEKTGVEWENPYTHEQERFRLELSNEEKAEVETKIQNGYYSEKAIAERSEARRIVKIEAMREEIIRKCDEAEQNARNKRDVMLYIIDNGLPTDNVIYYNHTKEVVFNWKDYDKKITQEQFVDFVNSIDYSKLPIGTTFSIKSHA